MTCRCSNLGYFCDNVQLLYRFQLIFYFSGSTENVEAVDGNNPDQGPPSPEKQIQHRANTTMHVCWHRNTSVSKRDFEKAVKVTILRIFHCHLFIYTPSLCNMQKILVERPRKNLVEHQIIKNDKKI